MARKAKQAGGAGGTAAAGEGRAVRWAKNRNTKIIRTSDARWSVKAEGVFLDELAATANVSAAAAAAGFSTTAIYRRRKMWPEFAEKWQACLDQGYARIETALVELASDSLLGAQVADAGEGGAGGEGGAADAPAAGASIARRAMTIAEAMNLLRLHRASVKGGAPQHYDARAKPPDIEAVRASILRKIEAIERGRAQRAFREAAE
ncbi:hypothetical protein RZN05_11475 [Sphingomonas sp. HF-S4]|uniref:Terminase n=1 Tax=Sphingomonas agrestis TaxID=3080540 RepID=A0ABU3Y8B6_9SPHN|nr:hypothetical protein [Sphingomonas sp. HF-S4]MDV3457606.1 hypothetical protein [Sphingomonas sp. HF-S4]